MYIKKKDILQKGITDVLQHASHIETCYQKKKKYCMETQQEYRIISIASIYYTMVQLPSNKSILHQGIIVIIINRHRKPILTSWSHLYNQCPSA